MPAPRNTWTPVPVGQPLDESIAPLRVGGGGLTDCKNLIYERENGWGKRSGSARAYRWANAGAFPGAPVSGIRWYRAYPSPLTKTVFSAGGSLWAADDQGSAPKKLLDFTAAPKQPVTFCSARDPNAMDGNGSDVLIICGGKSSLGFASDFILITTSGPNGPGTVGQNPAPTAKIKLQFKRDAGSNITPGSGDAFQVEYQVLPTDNPTTIAAALIELINQAYAVATNGPGPDPDANCPFLGQAYQTAPSQAFGHPTGSVIHLGALLGGTAGNDITYTLTYTAGANGMGGNGGEITFTDADGTHGPYSSSDESYTSSGWTGGGSALFGPLKWDGENDVDGLSFQITKAFHDCASWHDHVWYWGASSDPDTLFASDIDQPEGFTFMTQEGGYDIGVGDGDPAIQDCVPIGNTLYCLKTNSIYAITGYDFQSGEYQFQVQPQVQGYGVPASQCAAVLENALVFWSGRKFMRLSVGAFEPEHIGVTIPKTEGYAATVDQSAIRAVAGDFQTLSALNDTYDAGGTPSNVVRSSLALFAIDSDTVLVFDNEASGRLGKPAWSKWNGWNVQWWIPFGLGPSSDGTTTDEPVLLWLAPPADSLLTAYQYGADAFTDDGAAIAWMAQTGWVNSGSPELQKNLHRIFLELEATAGATMALTVTPAQTNLPDVQLSPPQPYDFDATVAPSGGEAYSVVYLQLPDQIVSPGYLFRFDESGASNAAFELLSFALDLVSEALTP